MRRHDLYTDFGSGFPLFCVDHGLGELGGDDVMHIEYNGLLAVPRRPAVRLRPTGGLHPDQVDQFASRMITGLLPSAGIRISIGECGRWVDNTVSNGHDARLSMRVSSSGTMPKAEMDQLLQQQPSASTLPRTVTARRLA